MLHTLYTVDPQVFLYVIVVYYTTWATVFLWAFFGESGRHGGHLSPIFSFLVGFIYGGFSCSDFLPKGCAKTLRVFVPPDDQRSRFD